MKPCGGVQLKEMMSMFSSFLFFMGFLPPPPSFYNNYSVPQFTDGWTAWIADDGKNLLSHKSASSDLKTHD